MTPIQSVTVDVFLSVDGWAGSENLPGYFGYFGYFGPELEQWINAELARPQLVLMGRRTYQALAGLPAEAVDDASDTVFTAEKIVFSRTLTAVTWPNTHLVRDDAVHYVTELKNTSDKPMRTMGSLSIARQLLAAGSVDRLRLMTFPLLAGPDGRETFFADATSADLRLIDHRIIDGRVLLTEYIPTGDDIPRA